MTSKDAAAVKDSCFITLADTPGAISDIPIAGLALLVGVARWKFEIRTLANACGNAGAMIVGATWEGAFDRSKLTRSCSNQRFKWHESPDL